MESKVHFPDSFITYPLLTTLPIHFYYSFNSFSPVSLLLTIPQLLVSYFITNITRTLTLEPILLPILNQHSIHPFNIKSDIHTLFSPVVMQPCNMQ
jgi:hypothetical protein